MTQLNGKLLLGRPVRVKPGVPRSDQHLPLGRRDPDSTDPKKQDFVYPQKFAFERWTRDDASSHWYGYAAGGRRLFVGGLPRMRDQATVDYEIRKVFYGFNMYAFLHFIFLILLSPAVSFGRLTRITSRHLHVQAVAVNGADTIKSFQRLVSFFGRLQVDEEIVILTS